MSTIYEDADLEMIFFKGTPEFDYTGIMHAPYDKDAFDLRCNRRQTG